MLFRSRMKMKIPPFSNPRIIPKIPSMVPVNPSLCSLSRNFSAIQTKSLTRTKIITKDSMITESEANLSATVFMALSVELFKSPERFFGRES